MAPIQKFIYTWPDGTTPIDFHAWVATLSKEEQDEFAQSLARQLAFRQQSIDDGLLALVPEVGYKWKDKDTMNIGKPTDPTWHRYWNRWQDETGVIFKIEIIEK